MDRSPSTGAALSAKSIGAIAVVALAALAGYWYESPELAWRQLQAAAQSGNQAAFDELVDYPRVRERLKRQFSDKLGLGPAAADSAPSSVAGALAALGAAVGAAVTGPLLDVAVQSGVIRRFVRDGEFALRPDDLTRAASSPTATTTAADAGWQTRREGFDRFIAEVPAGRRQADERRPAIVMERTGFATWRMTEIRIPALQR